MGGKSVDDSLGEPISLGRSTIVFMPNIGDGRNAIKNRPLAMESASAPTKRISPKETDLAEGIPSDHCAKPHLSSECTIIVATHIRTAVGTYV